MRASEIARVRRDQSQILAAESRGQDSDKRQSGPGNRQPRVRDSCQQNRYPESERADEQDHESDDHRSPRRLRPAQSEAALRTRSRPSLVPGRETPQLRA